MRHGRPDDPTTQGGHAGCQDFVSAQDLYALLVAGDHAIGLTTVYRALRELEADGGVDVGGAADASGTSLGGRRSRGPGVLLGDGRQGTKWRT